MVNKTQLQSSAALQKWGLNLPNLLIFQEEIEFLYDYVFYGKRSNL